MCGIICGKNYLINELEIKNSINKLWHRGPDEHSLFFLNDIFLGHTRLSIVDIEGGSQPLFNENKSISAVVNGEFYDYKEIKKNLIQKGHIFATLSDSEILIHLYEEYGINCLDFLNGEFAFVLFDNNKKQWFCARDRIGTKPLQFYFKDNMFLISSEAKALLEFKNIKTEFNKEAFWFSQHLQYLPLNQTLFKNIEMIKPAHFLILKDGDIPKQFEYWSLKNINEKHISFEDAKNKSKFLIEQSIKKRIPKEVNWATHLSGGIDSSIVTAISSKFSNQAITSFNIQFTEDEFYDESIFAKETAQFLGINLITIPVSFEDLINQIPNAVFHAEGLSINGHLAAKYILNKEINKAGFKVTLSGEGSDEFFMGYSHLKQDYLTANSLNNLEKNYLIGFQLPDSNTLDLSYIQKNIGFIPTWIQAKSSMAYKFKNLWNKDFKFSNNPYEIISEELKGHQSKLKSASTTWTKYCLSGYILKVLDDAQSMAHHIEGRLPFLDTELIEFMYSIPDNIYFHNNIEKGLLREGFKNDLPKSFLNRTKQSFMSPPINRFLKNEGFLKIIDQYILSNKKLENLGIFNNKQIKNLLTSKEANQNNIEPILMTLLCTGIFVEKFL